MLTTFNRKRILTVLSEMEPGEKLTTIGIIDGLISRYGPHSVPSCHDMRHFLPELVHEGILRYAENPHAEGRFCIFERTDTITPALTA